MFIYVLHVLVTYCIMGTNFCLIITLPPPSFLGGFQGMPNSLRQPGPRANPRHLTPNASAQGPRSMGPSGAQRIGKSGLPQYF